MNFDPSYLLNLGLFPFSLYYVGSSANGSEENYFVSNFIAASNGVVPAQAAISECIIWVMVPQKTRSNRFVLLN